MMDAAEIARLRESGNKTTRDLCDALEQARKDAATLAADQCQDGYGDEYGNHGCRVVDAMRTQRDAARKERDDAQAVANQREKARLGWEVCAKIVAAGQESVRNTMLTRGEVDYLLDDILGAIRAAERAERFGDYTKERR